MEIVQLTEKEFDLILNQVQQKDTRFNEDFSALQNAILGQPFSEFKVKRFVDKNDFYRPENSEFITSYNEQNGYPITAYSMHFAKSVLILKRNDLGHCEHLIYSTDNDKGFYLAEIYQLLVTHSL